MNRPLPYELTCPSCGQTARLPFVRLGATAKCPACGHRHRIQTNHVRYMRPLAESSSSPTPPLPPSEGSVPPARRWNFPLGLSVGVLRSDIRLRAAALTLVVIILALVVALRPQAQPEVPTPDVPQAVQAPPAPSQTPEAPAAPAPPPAPASNETSTISALPAAGASIGLPRAASAFRGR